MKEENKIWIILSVFFFLGAFNIWHHEMWRDELQAWLIAKNSLNIYDVFKNLEYDGHPALWHILLFFITRFDVPPFAMQILHLLLAVFSAWIFLKHAPFSLLHKSLFIFGYFPFYEYAVISRNYVLAMLLLFLFCTFYKRLPEKIILLSVFLFLLCQTHIFGLITAICLAAVMFIPAFSRTTVPIRKSKMIVALLVFGTGLVLGLVQMIPPPDSGFASKWIFEFKPDLQQKTISVIWQSFVPIPSPRISFWNSNVLNFADIWIQVFLSVFLLVFSFGMFMKKPPAMVLFLSGTVGILFFTYIKYFGFLRHFGNLYLLFISTWWISTYMKEEIFHSGTVLFSQVANFFSRYKNKFLTSILSVQMAAGIMANYFDFHYTFSQGENVAEFLGKNETDNLLIETSEYFTTITVAGFLDKKVYHPQCNRFGSFVVWDKCSGGGLLFSEAFEKSKKLSAEQKKDAILLSMQEQDTVAFSIRLIAEFSDSSIVAEERYYLYKFFSDP